MDALKRPVPTGRQPSTSAKRAAFAPTQMLWCSTTS